MSAWKGSGKGGKDGGEVGCKGEYSRKEGEVEILACEGRRCCRGMGSRWILRFQAWR